MVSRSISDASYAAFDPCGYMETSLKPWPNDYTFLSTFAIHLYCKSRAMYCVVAKRLDISLYSLFAFTEDFSPSQQQPVKQHKRAQIFMIKWSAIEENNCT